MDIKQVSYTKFRMHLASFINQVAKSHFNLIRLGSTYPFIACCGNLKKFKILMTQAEKMDAAYRVQLGLGQSTQDYKRAA